MNWEAAAINKICSTADFQSAVDAKIDPSLFTNYVQEYQFVVGHFTKHSKPPSRDKLKGAFPEFPGDTTEDNISEIVETLQNRRSYKQIREVWGDIQETMKTYAKKGTSLDEKCKGSNIILELMRKAVVEHDEATEDTEELRLTDTTFCELFEQEYIERRDSDGVIGVPFPWATPTRLSQGLLQGDIVTVAARNGNGKTWCVLYWALKLWLEHDYPILWVSNEMTLQSLIFRAMAIMMKVPYGKMKEGKLGDDVFAAKMASVRNMLGKKAGTPFVLTSAEDGMGVGGVLSLENKIDKVRKELLPGSKELVMFIDGAYLLADDRKAKDKYQKVGNIVDDLKVATKRKKIVTIISWQLNRGATRGESEERNLAYTDKINAHSSYVIAIERDEDMVEMKEAIIKSLKVRECNPFAIRTAFNFMKMDFEELEDDPDKLPDDDLSAGGFTTEAI